MNKSIATGSIKSISEEGILKGYGAIFGNVDLQGDVISPGAFRDTLSDFVQHGYLCESHQWDRRIGTIETAREDSKGLYFEAKFHTTQFAQECRRVIAERLARGKSVALSIGFNILEENPHAKGFREILKLKLFEVSIVTVGANSLAMAVGLKMADADMRAHRAECDKIIMSMQRRWRENVINEMQLRYYKQRIAELER